MAATPSPSTTVTRSRPTSRAAERVIAASTATSVPSEFFDQLWEALGAPPRPNEPLRRRAAEPRRVQQR
jgi:uncharacterized protein (DUF1778 family)